MRVSGIAPGSMNSPCASHSAAIASASAREGTVSAFFAGVRARAIEGERKAPVGLLEPVSFQKRRGRPFLQVAACKLDRIDGFAGLGNEVFFEVGHRGHLSAPRRDVEMARESREISKMSCRTGSQQGVGGVIAP